MAFVNALDAATPADTDFAKFGALEIRTKAGAVRERLSSFFTNIDTDPLEAKDGALLGNVNVKTLLPRIDNTYALGSALFRYVNIFSVTATISGNTTIAGTLGVTGIATFTNQIINTAAGIAVILVAGVNSTFGSSKGIYWYRADGTTVRAQIGYPSNNDQTFAVGTQEAGGITSIRSGNAVAAINISATSAVTLTSTLGVAGLITGSAGLTLTGDLVMNTAFSRIIPGVTGFAIKNNANTVANFIILDGGDVSIGGTLVVTSALTVGSITTAGNMTGALVSGTAGVRATGGVLEVGNMATTNSNVGNFLISNSVAPTGIPIGGGILWVDSISGALRFIGAAGTLTSLAPS